MDSLSCESKRLNATVANGVQPLQFELRFWLWSLAFLVFLMVIIGGATRLTESGLSITEWKPITGVIPPLNDAEWQKAFGDYKRIPQYSINFPDMTLEGFKFIFFWEWSHRLLGRIIGLAAALPLIYFWRRGVLTTGLKLKLLGVVALGGFQGFIGWWMVQSGLESRVEVAQQRLAVHLVLASITFSAIVWIAASLKESRPGLSSSSRGIFLTFAITALICLLLQIGFGALMAGLRAGSAYNTWPLMDGVFIPPIDKLTALSPLWLNFSDNLLTVQFQHRLMAYSLLFVVAAQAIAAQLLLRDRSIVKRTRLIALLVLAQAGIGITTLLLAVPLWSGLLHQAMAMVVLAFCAVHAQMLMQRGEDNWRTAII